jgi:tetratricopeptide (TPR) repeat protein
VRGEILFKRDPANPAPAEQPLLAAIDIAREQGSRSFALRAALSLAKLYQSTARPVEAHAVLAPALERFAPTPEMPEIAEAHTLLAALEEMAEVKADAARRRRTTQLRVAYGNALMAARGYGAPETAEAFAVTRELADGHGAAQDRLAADYGLWASSVIRGELTTMRAHAAAFLADVEAKPSSPEAGVAHRCAGTTHWFAGEYREARDHLERALALFQPGQDDDLAFRFGQDAGIPAMLHLAMTWWQLGDVERAISVADRARARMAALTYVATRAYGNMHAAIFELMRGGDLSQAAANASELARVACDHDLPLYRAMSVFLVGWANSEGGVGALEDMRRGVELVRGQNCQSFVPLLKLALGRAEARAGDLDRAVTTLDEGLALSDRTGQRGFEAELHRARGMVLLRRNPSNPTPAEDEFQTAVIVARQQGARSYELLASLSLAKLYQSTGRPVDAHAVLAPALEGFAPTPEMPEIAEAQTLLAELADSDEVKADAARRQQRQDLQVGMANALLQGRGIHAPETQAAFERADELGAGVDPMERLAILYGRWAGELVRGDTRRMLEIAGVMMERASDGPAALGTHRCLGMSRMYAGDLADAETALRWVVDHYDFDRHQGLAVRFSYDPGVVATYYLAFTRWLRGDADAAHALIADAHSLAKRVDHPPTIAATFGITAFLDCVRRDPMRALVNAERTIALASDFNLPTWSMIGSTSLSQARADLAATLAGWEDLRATLARCDAQGFGLPEIHRSYLAQGYAEVGELEAALAQANQALANIEARGLRAFLPEAHRVRGEILWRQNPTDFAEGEAAFEAAIAAAREQGSRSFGLRGALALAKLYQSTGRPAEAHTVLGSALEGFSPTPEMPEITEAQTLLAGLRGNAIVLKCDSPL